MIKLSEISNDTMLCVQHRYDGDISVMSKEDFLESSYFLDYPAEPFPVVTVAEVETKTFDLAEVIEQIGEDDTYEGWSEDVFDSLMALPETSAFLQKVKEVFESRPIYWEGKPLEIDIFSREVANEN